MYKMVEFLVDSFMILEPLINIMYNLDVHLIFRTSSNNRSHLSRVDSLYAIKNLTHPFYAIEV
jgi:hypothetical protein